MNLRNDMADVWQALLGCAPSPDSTFLHDGGSSLQLMSFQLEVQRRTGRLIDLDDVAPPFRFASLLAALEQASIDSGRIAGAPSELSRVVFLTNPTEPAGQIEGRAILRGRPISPPPSLPMLVRDAAERTPDAVAVSDGPNELRYRVLFSAATRLAARIEKIPGVSGGIVLLSVEPGIEYAVGVLATIMAGAHAAPIHPEFPTPRVRSIQRQARPAVILTGSGGKSPHAGALEPGPVIIPVEVDLAATDPVDVPYTSIHDPCYALFTSGSTGVPKGVLMHQLPVANLARFEAGRTRGGLRTAQFAPLGFDVAFQEMFGTWASGGELIVVPLACRRNPARLVEFLDEHGIERLYCVPLVLRLLARAANQLGRPLSRLREIVTSGEPLRIDDDVRRFGAACGGLRVSNQLGAAETIQTTHLDLGEDPSDWEDVPGLGQPIDGVNIRVIGDDGMVVEVGTEGSIEVGGCGPALGYLDLESPRFRRDDEGSWYDTGDRGVLHADGRLEFRGRRDAQVKIRGFRVELGEVEKTLAGLDELDDAAVVAVAGPDGSNRLAAMVVPAGDTDADRVRDAARSRLPEWMVPQRIVLTDRLPSSGNNKIDRLEVQRLLGPDNPQPCSQRSPL